MKYPELIPKRLCTTEVEVVIEQEGLTVYGGPLEPVTWKGRCNYQDKGKTVLTAEKKLIKLSGCALIPGDIAPDVPAITDGSIVVHGIKRKIYQGTKARNPDGSINYTRLDVE